MKKPYYRALGITRDEYLELRSVLASGKDLYCWNGMTNVKRLLKAILYYADLAHKAAKFVEFLVIHEARHGIPLAVFDDLMKVRAEAETRWLFMMQDRSPASIRERKPISECHPNYRRWSRNKANYAKLIDEFAIRYIRGVFPDDGEMMGRAAECELKWASRRMPGSKPFKRGRRPGKAR